MVQKCSVDLAINIYIGAELSSDNDKKMIETVNNLSTNLTPEPRWTAIEKIEKKCPSRSAGVRIDDRTVRDVTEGISI